MLIEICVNCWNYQHRLDWMLSSVVQQDGDVPDLLFNVSFVPNNGEPTTEEILGYFKYEAGANIKKTILKDQEEASCRGYIRQRQLDETEADWILFADCDMAYSKNFFSDLKSQLEGGLKDVTQLVTANRISLGIDFCSKYFKNNPVKKPYLVENISDILSDWPVYRVSGKGGPGNLQLANVKHCRENDIKYTHHCRDLWRGTRSDRHFRLNMGGIHPIETEPMYHLNHDRAGPDEQR